MDITRSTGSLAASILRASPDYCYSPLPEACIRLLRLMPHKDECTPIQCQIFDYHLLGSDEGHHLYEALSYVWGTSEKLRTVYVDKARLAVTENLHAALSRLRDRSLPRIIWADAICINQDDTQERDHQVLFMAEIYAKASRVVVWLGEPPTAGGGQADQDGAEDGDLAIESMRVAAHTHYEQSSEAFNSDQEVEHGSNAVSSASRASEGGTDKRAILALLQHHWFRRIWVLQEVAAARQVLVVCRSTEIDGLAFCSGLSALNLTLQDLATQTRVRSATYLMRGAAFRTRHHAGAQSKKFSLAIRPMGELIDMYHNREAKDRRDKVYALLGMGSDDDIPDGLLPDYELPWRILFHRLVTFLVGEQVSVKTWDDEEIAVVEGKGCIVGEVSSVTGKNSWDDRQNVNVTVKNSSGYFQQWGCRWTLQASARPIQEGDVVCLLQGASKPSIVRLHDDYCSVVAIAVTPPVEKTEYPPKEISGSTMTFPRGFLLVWDWEASERVLDEFDDYECAQNSQLWRQTRTCVASNSGSRLEAVGLLLHDLQKYEDASRKLQEAIETYVTIHGKESLCALAAMDHLAAIHKSHGGQKNRERAEKLSLMADLLGKRGNCAKITEDMVIRVAENFDGEVMTILLDQMGQNAQISEGALEAAARNVKSGKEVMDIFFTRQGSRIAITEETVKAAAGNEGNGKEILTLLLDQWGGEITITEDVVKAAAGNSCNGEEILTLLLDRCGHEITITEKVIYAAAKNIWRGEEVMTTLLDRRGDEITITEEVMIAAGTRDARVATLLLKRRRDQIPVTEDMVRILANLGKDTITLLLDRPDGEICVTEGMVSVLAAYFQKDVMTLLLKHEKGRVPVTEEVVKGAARNLQAYGQENITLLLSRGNDPIHITEEMLCIVAERFNSDVMALLLDRLDHSIPVTEDVAKAAAGNSTFGSQTVTLLLRQQGSQAPMKEVVHTILHRLDGGVTKLLLDRWGNQITITDEMVEAAVKNQRSSKEVMSLLLDRWGDQIHPTEELAKAAADNHGSGNGLITLLLNRWEDKFPITEEVVKAAVGNRRGKNILLQLLNQRGDDIPITKGVVKAAAGNGEDGVEVLVLLLDRWGDQIHITEEVVKAAVENTGNGQNILKLLLDRRGDQVPITEAVVKAAAGNRSIGHEVMKLLLDRRGDQIPIDEGVVKAAAGNERRGLTIVALLLKRRPKATEASITRETYWAAATCGQERLIDFLSERHDRIPVQEDWRRIARFYNAAQDGKIAVVNKLLIEGVQPDLKNVEGETPLMIAAIMGRVEVVQALARRTDVNVNSVTIYGRSSLFWASYMGSEQVVPILIKAGADVGLRDVNGDRAIDAARCYGYDKIEKILKQAAESEKSELTAGGI